MGIKIIPNVIPQIRLRYKNYTQCYTLYFNQNLYKMKHLLLSFLLLSAVNLQAQKIISHSRVIANFFDNKIEETVFMEGGVSYAIFLTSDNKNRVTLKFNTREHLIRCLRYLYDFDKGEGYFIDLENASHDTVLTGKHGGYWIKDDNSIRGQIIYKRTFGKLLIALGEKVDMSKSIPKNDDKTDDTYRVSDGVY